MNFDGIRLQGVCLFKVIFWNTYPLYAMYIVWRPIPVILLIIHRCQMPCIFVCNWHERCLFLAQYICFGVDEIFWSLLISTYMILFHVCSLNILFILRFMKRFRCILGNLQPYVLLLICRKPFLLWKKIILRNKLHLIFQFGDKFLDSIHTLILLTSCAITWLVHSGDSVCFTHRPLGDLSKIFK